MQIYHIMYLHKSLNVTGFDLHVSNLLVLVVNSKYFRLNY